MMGIKGMNAGALRRAVALAALALLAVAAAGCGEDDYANMPRPPAVKTITVFIGEDRLAYSPREIGAGPALFIIANQTGADQLVTISQDRQERSFPLARSQTIQQKLTLEEGFLSVEADNSAGDTIEIEVGPERESAQQDLNQP